MDNPPTEPEVTPQAWAVSENEHQSLIRSLRMSAQSNHLLLHAAGEDELLDNFTRVLVELGGYGLAWVIFEPEDGEGRTQHRLEYVALAGGDQNLFDLFSVQHGDNPVGRIARQAIETGAMVVVNSADSHHTMQARGIAAQAALPFLIDESESMNHARGQRGVLVACAAQGGVFNDGELALLQEMARNLGYGLATLRARGRLAEIAKRLSVSEHRYRTLFEQAADGIFLSDSAGHYIDANISGLKLLGYTRDELLQLTMNDLLSEFDREHHPINFTALKLGETLRNERMLIKKDGSLLAVEVTKRLLPNGIIQSILRQIVRRNQPNRAEDSAGSQPYQEDAS